jgi:hypothetical protein
MSDVTAQSVSLILSHEELCAITGRRRHSAQARVLAQMNISYRLRPDGFPVVSRAHFEEAMGTKSYARFAAAAEPNWDAIRRKTDK